MAGAHLHRPWGLSGPSRCDARALSDQGLPRRLKRLHKTGWDVTPEHQIVSDALAFAPPAPGGADDEEACAPARDRIGDLAGFLRHDGVGPELSSRYQQHHRAAEAEPGQRDQPGAPRPALL